MEFATSRSISVQSVLLLSVTYIQYVLSIAPFHQRQLTRPCQQCHYCLVACLGSESVFMFTPVHCTEDVFLHIICVWGKCIYRIWEKERRREGREICEKRAKSGERQKVQASHRSRPDGTRPLSFSLLLTIKAIKRREGMGSPRVRIYRPTWSQQEHT